MVHGNVTSENSVDYTSGVVIYSVAAAIGIFIVLYMVYSFFEKDLHAICLNHGCICLLPSRVHPDGSIGPAGVRKPTSAERIIALGILSQSPKGTTIKEIEAELIKNPPNNGNQNILSDIIEPQWKNKKVVTYDIKQGTVISLDELIEV